MRTVGTFTDVFEAAREYLSGSLTGRPYNPVVRIDRNGKWMIESKLESDSNIVGETSLDDFCAYWYDGLNDVNFVPEEKEITEYSTIISEINE